jgi:plastocyanin
MRARGIALVLIITAVLVPAPSVTVPAQAQGARQVIAVSMTSWKFEPSLITVKQGDTVVLQLSNNDVDRRNHSFAARWLIGKQVTVRGQIAREGEDDSRRFFAVAPEQKAEIEFVMSDRGSFPFVCGVFDHGSRGQVGAINVLGP